MTTNAAEAPPRPGARPDKIVSQNVSKIYQTPRGPMVALDDFTLNVGEGEFVCVVGPSGCG